MKSLKQKTRKKHKRNIWLTFISAKSQLSSWWQKNVGAHVNWKCLRVYDAKAHSNRISGYENRFVVVVFFFLILSFGKI